MASFADKTGSRIAMGIVAGTALGVVLGPLLVWVPLGIVAGAIWEKKR